MEMQNLYEIIKGSLFFNRLVLDDLVCVEYTCPLEDEQMGIFTKYDYIIHVLSGKKSWKTLHGEWTITAGHTLYVKKGASIITQDFDEDFCMLGFFLPDDLIQSSLKDTVKQIPVEEAEKLHGFTACELDQSAFLDSYFRSMLTYFRQKEQPPDSLLRLKIRELLINIIFNSNDTLLPGYLRSMVDNIQPSLTQIMESNFCYNLKIEEFARLCHRSLSTFKRDFHNHYNCTPGKWLQEKRLDYAAGQILLNASNISQIAFGSGFEDLSHFSRVFRQKFGVTPSEYRKSFA